MDESTLSGEPMPVGRRVGVAVQLAWREEPDARTEFGAAYTRSEANTPAFLPRFGVHVQA